MNQGNFAFVPFSRVEAKRLEQEETVFTDEEISRSVVKDVFCNRTAAKMNHFNRFESAAKETSHNQGFLRERNYLTPVCDPSQSLENLLMPLEQTSTLLENSASFRRGLLDSVSSDPEIYTKTSTSEKLKEQIQKLRDDMLALRCTTSFYKQHMEAIFDQLKAIAIMHDSSVNTNFHSGGKTGRYQTGRAIAAMDLRNSQPIAAAMKSDSDDSTQTILMDHKEKQTFTSTPKQDPNEEALSTSLPSYQDAVAASQIPKYDAQAVPAHASPGRKFKISERPNSDPFVSRSGESSRIFPETERAKDSIAAKYSVKSADSSLENESKRSRGKSDQRRVFPVLTQSNGALHISECSIDSGYQGSSATSPRDRLGRELGSQAVTPASPISESPVAKPVKRENQKPLGNGHLSATRHAAADPCAIAESPPSDPSAFKTDAYFVDKTEKQLCRNSTPDSRRAVCNKDDGEITREAELNLSEKLSKDVTNPSERSRKRSESNASDRNAPSDRPIPKQRTIFSSSNPVPPTVANASLTNDTNENSIEHAPRVRVASEADNRASLSGDEKLNASDGRVQEAVTRPQPPQRLPLSQQPFQSAPSDSGSPLQSRVKLGVSAIKQLTPKSENKEGGVFYCVGQATRASDANARVARKPLNAKQLLREKFAAAVERSSKAAAKKEQQFTENESDWSMVRRRSMRMMTEFQIFDFKQGSSAKNSGVDLKKGEKVDSNQEKLDVNRCKVTKLGDRRDEVSSGNKYSVSPSAAVVSKQVFQTESSTDVTSLQTKISCSGGNGKMKKTKDDPPRYAGKPLPPPPPSPPRTPPGKAEVCPNPPRSQNVSHSKPSINTPSNPVFLAPIIRPKAAAPETCNSELKVTSLQKPTFNGLKLSPNSKSAFTPVASCSVNSIDEDEPPPPSQGRGRVNPTQDKPQTPDLHLNPLKPEGPDARLSQAGQPEPKRRSSLPQSALSNKQRFLKEFMPNSSTYQATESPASADNESFAEMTRRSTHRIPRRNVEPAKDTVISAETHHVTSYEVPAKSEEASTGVPNKAPFSSTEPLFSVLPKESSLRENKRHRHASGGKLRTSSASSSNQHLSLEHQPVSFSRSEKIGDVVGALRAAGRFQDKQESQSTKKGSKSSTKSPVADKKHLKNDKSSCTPVERRERPKHLLEPTSRLQTSIKARSSSSLHQYETVKLLNNNQAAVINSKNKKSSSRDATPDEPSRHRGTKSTIAMIRDSLLGKREKTRSSTAEGRRALADSGVKVRSSSVGDKLKINESSFFDSKFTSKNKKKETKSKKEKTESKSSRKEKSSGKNSLKTSEKTVMAGTPSDDAFIFPEPARLVGYGNPDAEVMERFLAAAAAAASDTPRSPLQRLRSSFRTPKNKSKNLLQETRIRDDMDVAHASYAADRHRNKSNFHNGQEFTYV